MSASTHGRRTASRLRSLMQQSDAGSKPIVIDALHFKEDGDGYLQRGSKRHLYMIDIGSERIDSLTSDPAFNNDLPILRRPNDRRIAFTKTHEKGADEDGREEHRRHRCPSRIDAAKSARVPLRRTRKNSPGAGTECRSPICKDSSRSSTRTSQDRLFTGPGARASPRSDGQAGSRGDVLRLQRDRRRSAIAVEDDMHHLPRSSRPDETRDHARRRPGSVRRLRAVSAAGTPRSSSPTTVHWPRSMRWRTDGCASSPRTTTDSFGSCSSAPSRTSGSRARTGRRSMG